MAIRKVSVHDGGAAKKLRLRDKFPGQMRFPEISPPLRLPVIIALFALAIVASAVVWWLKS